MQKYNKKVIATFSKELDGEEFEVIVCDGGYSELDKEAFWDVHVLSEKFKNDELNTLKLQEPQSIVKKEEFTKEKLIGYLMEHFIWDRFYNEGLVSCSVKVYEIEPH